MKPVYERGKMASWIAPPLKDINVLGLPLRGQHVSVSELVVGRSILPGVLVLGPGGPGGHLLHRMINPGEESPRSTLSPRWCSPCPPPIPARSR